MFATDAKQVLVVELKNWKVLGTVVGIITGIGTLMWQGMERFHQSEVDRIKGEAKADIARLQGEAKADMARLQDKVEMYRYYVQAVGTRDHEPLEEAMSQRQKEIKERAQTVVTGESGGEEGKEKKRGRGEDGGAGSLSPL